MVKGLIWATAEDLARNRGRVLSLYRQLLRTINSPKLPLNLATRLAMKAEVRTIFVFASEERSLHNIADLIDTAEYTLSRLRKGEIPTCKTLSKSFTDFILLPVYICDVDELYDPSVEYLPCIWHSKVTDLACLWNHFIIIFLFWWAPSRTGYSRAILCIAISVVHNP